MQGTLVRALASLVVPPLCVSCREPELSGSPVCDPCARSIVTLPRDRCLRCGAPTGYESAACGECRDRRLAFSRAWAPFAYEGVARRLVAALKSGGALSVASFMGAEIAARAPRRLLEGALVPVPAHALRRRRKGFNQAREIARGLGRATGLEMADVLRRDGTSRPQVGLERRARLANASGVRAAGPRMPSRLVLVDDVYTTGATLDACARVLRQAGAAQVTALTFARAVRG